MTAAKTCNATRDDLTCILLPQHGKRHYDGERHWQTETRKQKQGAVYRLADGRYAQALELPRHGTGRRRIVVTGQTEKAVEEKMKHKRRQLLINGDLSTDNITLASWLNIWYDTIATKKIRPRTAQTYRGYIDNHIIPTIGRVRLDKLTPEHIRRVAQTMTDQGLSSTSALQAHQILAGALKYAERENRVTKNVAKLTDAPRKARKELGILTPVDAVKIIQTVASDRLRSRWLAALFTGARQGELLGLEIDRVTDMLDLSWQLQRVNWEHGCGDECGKKRAADCPARKITYPADWEHRHLGGGLYLTRPKSNAGWRIIPLVYPLREAIEQRIEESKSEPNPHGLVWTADQKRSKGGHRQLLPLDGAPIDPSKDNRAWHDILDRAGVPQVRLHDARHTTASLLLEANVPQTVITKILGHSTYATSQGYMHVDRRQLDAAMSAIASRLGSNGTLKSLDTI